MCMGWEQSLVLFGDRGDAPLTVGGDMRRPQFSKKKRSLIRLSFSSFLLTG